MKNKIKSKIKYYFFLFKWFLIGKYHCNVPRKLRPYYWSIHKALWLFIVLSVSLTCARIVEIISGS